MDEELKSILTSTKKAIGVDKTCDHFDQDIIIHINTALMILTDLGVGPSTGFSITDKTAEWTDFLPSTSKRFEGAKSYVHLKVRMLFDPPSNAALKDAILQSLSELEWRLNVIAEIANEEED